MDYIIENANILKRNQITKCSFLIKDDRIASLQFGLKHHKLIKMNAEPYIMTPTYCLLNTKIPLNGTFQEVKDYMTCTFLRKGCTTLFTYVNISFENELSEKIKDTKTALLNSPIDFIIAVKISLHQLTQTLVRKCKKEKIPALFVEIKDPSELDQIPWGWIREALFPFNCPLIPVISSTLKKEVKEVLSKWKAIMIQEKIPSLFEEIEEDRPLSVNVLNKIGLYPHKASLMHGTELSYNLYLKGREIKNVDEVNLFHYHGDRLVVTVHRGKVVRSGEEVLFKPGNGEHVKVRTPSYFAL
ncbi:MAG TPA: hypothetical protein VGI04_05645 [Neobacillus sp.]